jgi:hypothetical protein
MFEEEREEWVKRVKKTKVTKQVFWCILGYLFVLVLKTFCSSNMCLYVVSYQRVPGRKREWWEHICTSHRMCDGKIF